LFCGYLKAHSCRLSGIGVNYICELGIPNNEIKRQYNLIFASWLREKMGMGDYSAFLKSLTESHVEKFTQMLGDFLMRSLSVCDVHGDSISAERFYPGFFVGLTASLQEYYHYASNRESGLGYYDVGLVPKDSNNPVGVILEFKKANKDDDPKTVAQTALMQIEDMHYGACFAEFPQVTSILKIGFAFCEKSVIATYKTTDILTGKDSDIQMAEPVISS